MTSLKMIYNPLYAVIVDLANFISYMANMKSVLRMLTNLLHFYRKIAKALAV